MEWLRELFDLSNPFILAANIVSFIGYTLFAIAAILKRKNQILICQSCANVICMVGEALVGAWSGFVQDGVNLIRNIFVLKKWANFVVSIVIIIVGTIIGVVVFILDFNNNGWWGIIPLVATLEYSIIILIPNIKIYYIKASIACNAVLWATYGAVVHIIPAVLFNAVTCVLAIASIIQYAVMIRKNK